MLVKTTNYGVFTNEIAVRDIDEDNAYIDQNNEFMDQNSEYIDHNSEDNNVVSELQVDCSILTLIQHIRLNSVPSKRLNYNLHVKYYKYNN